VKYLILSTIPNIKFTLIAKLEEVIAALIIKMMIEATLNTSLDYDALLIRFYNQSDKTA